jgi:Sec-independent protein translocase protein TatA
MVGIVALVVFGPRGLASAAKSLGAAARSLQPSIRELAEVSQDLKSTLEKEIGLDEIRKDFQGISSSMEDSLKPMPRTKPLPGVTGLEEATANNLQFNMDDAKAIDPDIEEKRRASSAAAWGAPQTPTEPAPKDLESMSVDELREEIARRKAEQQATASKKPVGDDN